MKIKKINDFITESNSQNDFGCMMLFLSVDKIKDLFEKINKKDIYTEKDDDSFGIEEESHVTIKYGFTKTVSDHDVLNKCRKVKFDNIKMDKISIFENDKFDVLKFEIKSDILNKLNKEISDFPNEDKYPDYNAHSTIAYLKKGKGKEYVEKFSDIKLEGLPIKLVYSNIDGTKLTFELK